MTVNASSDEATAEGLGRAARGAALNLAGAVITTVAGFGSVAVVSNRYGAAGAGVFLAAIAAYTLAANALKLGTESALTYLVARFRASDRRGSVRPIIRSAVLAVTAATVAVAVAVLATAQPLADVLTDDAELVDDMATMLQILAVGLPSWALLQVLGGASRGFSTMRPWLMSGQIIRPALQFLLLIAVAVATDALWPLAVAWVVGTTVAIVPLARWLHRRMAGFVEDDPADVAAARSELWAFSRPRALSDVVHAALERLDVVLVSILVGAAGAGLYGAANRMILAGQLVMTATGQAAAPELSDSFGRGDAAGAQRTIRGLTSWNVTLLWPVLAMVVAGAPALLPLLGDDFVAAESSLIVLAVAMLAIVALGVGDTAVLMAGRPRASLINHVAALVTMVTVAVVLLPQVGAVGAAWAWAASRLVLRILSVIIVWRDTGVTPFGNEVGLAMVVAAAVWTPIGLGHRMIADDSLALLVAATMLGLAVHGAAAYLLRRPLRLDELGQALAGRVSRRSRAG